MISEISVGFLQAESTHRPFHPLVLGGQATRGPISLRPVGVWRACTYLECSRDLSRPRLCVRARRFAQPFFRFDPLNHTSRKWDCPIRPSPQPSLLRKLNFDDFRGCSGPDKPNAEASATRRSPRAFPKRKRDLSSFRTWKDFRPGDRRGLPKEQAVSSKVRHRAILRYAVLTLIRRAPRIDRTSTLVRNRDRSKLEATVRPSHRSSLLSLRPNRPTESKLGLPDSAVASLYVFGAGQAPIGRNGGFRGPVGLHRHF